VRDADDVWRRRSKPWDARPSCRAFLYPLILIPFGIDPRRYTGGHASPFVMVDRATVTIAAKPARTKRPDSWFCQENRDKYSCFYAENRAVWPLAATHSGVEQPLRLICSKKSIGRCRIVLSLGKPPMRIGRPAKPSDMVRDKTRRYKDVAGAVARCSEQTANDRGWRMWPDSSPWRFGVSKR